MECGLCAGETAPREVRRQHWHKGRLYIVENVEAEVCQDCGERYFHARTLDRLDALIQGDHEVKRLLSVEIPSAGEPALPYATTRAKAQRGERVFPPLDTPGPTR